MVDEINPVLKQYQVVWFQRFFILTLIPGEMIEFDYIYILQMGWNHLIR